MTRIPPTLTLIRHTGLLFVGRSEEYRLTGSPEKLRPVLGDITHNNLLLGWWSPFSIFINPSVTLGNYFLFSLYRSRFNHFYKNEHSPPTAVMPAAQSASTGVAAGLFKYIIPTVLCFLAISIFTLATQR